MPYTLQSLVQSLSSSLSSLVSILSLNRNSPLLRLFTQLPGKNIHALDPQSIPTQAALKSAAVVVERLLAREKDLNNGQYPETIALVLWGTDNIKTYGESLAQVMMMVGVKPVADSLGR